PSPSAITWRTVEPTASGWSNSKVGAEPSSPGSTSTASTMAWSSGSGSESSPPAVRTSEVARQAASRRRSMVVLRVSAQCLGGDATADVDLGRGEVGDGGEEPDLAGDVDVGGHGGDDGGLGAEDPAVSGAVDRGDVDAFLRLRQ